MKNYYFEVRTIPDVNSLIRMVFLFLKSIGAKYSFLMISNIANANESGKRYILQVK